MKPNLRYAMLISIIVAAFLGSWLIITGKSEVNAKDASVEGCGVKNCKECHAISKQEVEGVFKKLNSPQLKVLNIQMSPVKGLWEISIEDNGQRGLIYIDFSKEFLVTGSIISVAGGTNVTQEKAEELERERKVDVSKIPVGDALVMGDKNAAKKVILFTDPG